ncbi:MAG: hypothetical protein P1U40_13600 [Coxiellaceae bacterium]|nr:hypothetical protein [Coxiellaceae bacterium]
MLEAYRERFRRSFESHRAYFDGLDRESQAELQNILVCLDKYEGLLTEPLFVRLIDSLESYHFAELSTLLSSIERLKGTLDSGDIVSYLAEERLAAATIALAILIKADIRFGPAEFAVKLDQLIAVCANPVVSMIYGKRGIGYCDYSVWQEPITQGVALRLVVKGASDDVVERRVSEVFDELNCFRSPNPSQMQMMYDMADPAYYSPEAQAQDAVQGYFVAQLNDDAVSFATTLANHRRLTREGALAILPPAELYRLVAQIEEGDSYSTRDYKEMMGNVAEMLSAIRSVDVSEALTARMAREAVVTAVVPPGVAASMVRHGLYHQAPETAGAGTGEHMADDCEDADSPGDDRRPLL